MTTSLVPHPSVGHIRRRLFLLLMQAFGAVVLLTVVLLLGLIGVLVAFVSQNDETFRPPLAGILETYYLARGSWADVAQLSTLAEADPNFDWQRVILLDSDNRLLLDHGRADGPNIGQPYELGRHPIRFTLRVNDELVGTLVFDQQLVLGPLSLLVGLLPPVVFISFFTGLLTLLIGFLLTRRVVTPLADVIAAAQSVAAGDLSARVSSQKGEPGDLRSLSDSFNHMAETLERNDRDRRNWLADIAHELRTPLTVMRGKLEGMVDGVYRADEEHVAPVLAQTYMLERLVDDLRLLTLAEARQLHLDLKPVNLGALAQRAAGLFEAEADERNIALAVNVEAGLPTVTADPQRVEQVIGNLVSNALRYVPENSRVEISARRVAGGVEVAVSDNGPGISDADLPHLFDRFWRGEKSRARAAGGAGLGLAIARQLIEAQGGTLTARQAEAGGLHVALALKN